MSCFHQKSCCSRFHREMSNVLSHFGACRQANSLRGTDCEKVSAAGRAPACVESFVAVRAAACEAVNAAVCATACVAVVGRDGMLRCNRFLWHWESLSVFGRHPEARRALMKSWALCS